MDISWSFHERSKRQQPILQTSFLGRLAAGHGSHHSDVQQVLTQRVVTVYSSSKQRAKTGQAKSDFELQSEVKSRVNTVGKSCVRYYLSES
jgi:hypothetical protein